MLTSVNNVFKRCRTEESGMEEERVAGDPGVTQQKAGRGVAGHAWLWHRRG